MVLQTYICTANKKPVGEHSRPQHCGHLAVGQFDTIYGFTKELTFKCYSLVYLTFFCCDNVTVLSAKVKVCCHDNVTAFGASRCRSHIKFEVHLCSCVKQRLRCSRRPQKIVTWAVWFDSSGLKPAFSFLPHSRMVPSQIFLCLVKGDQRQ